jgi:hypothetical protein
MAVEEWFHWTLRSSFGWAVAVLAVMGARIPAGSLAGGGQISLLALTLFKMRLGGR